MTDNNNNDDDQKWLNALAGKPDADANPVTNAQAKALRTAMVARRLALEQATQQADPAELARLRARLQREGLLQVEGKQQKKAADSWLGALLGNWFPSVGAAAAAIPTWSLATNLVLAVVVVQVGMGSTSPNNEAMVLRGGAATVLLAPNPELRLGELMAGLKQAGAHHVVARKPNGVLHLLVQQEDVALDYLLSQRIEPHWVDGIGVIELRKP